MVYREVTELAIIVWIISAIIAGGVIGFERDFRVQYVKLPLFSRAYCKVSKLFYGHKGLNQRVCVMINYAYSLYLSEDKFRCDSIHKIL